MKSHKDRLRVVLEWFRAAGVKAEGTVVSDPMARDAGRGGGTDVR